MRRAAALTLLAFLACTSQPRGVLAPIYAAYNVAVNDRNLPLAKGFLSAGRLHSIEHLSENDALNALSVVSPKDDLTVAAETIAGNEGTLVLRATVAGNVSTGRVSFARENGAWKIYSEAWDVGTAPEKSDLAAPPPPAANAEAIRALKERGYAMPSAEFLAMAAGTGDLEAVKLFVKAGYSVDARSSGEPAIVQAAMSNHPEVVVFLIGAGANVNAVDEVNTTALMRAADHCDATPAIQALLKAGAKTDVRAAGGATALQLAEWAHCDENARLIREAAGRQ